MVISQSAADHYVVKSVDAPDLEILSDLTFGQLQQSDAEDQFGRLVRLARRIFIAPIAVLTLVDGSRHQLLAESGLEESKSAPEMAFCDRVLLSSAPLAVSDARSDPLFAECSSVRHAPFIRSYFGAPLIDNDGERIGTIGVLDYEARTIEQSQLDSLVDLSRIAVDELRLKSARCEAEYARRQLYDAIEALPDGFILFDENDRLTAFNSRMLELYPENAKSLKIGRTFEEIVRDAIACGQLCDSEGREEEWLQDRLKRHRNPAGLIEQQTSDGRWLRIYEKKTSTGATVGFRADITELKLREAELFELATRDSLTGVLTRRSILDDVQREYVRLSRYTGCCCVLIIDVDHFKGVNDIFGHQTGDEALRRICAQIKLTIREADSLGRLGGEEFLIVLPDTELHGALITAERLRTEIANLNIACADGLESVSVTVSVGVAQFRRGESSKSLLARCDQSLYQAKLKGRNCVHADMDETVWSAHLVSRS